MSYPATQGLFAALGSVPGVVPPRTWLTMVVGQEPLKSQAEVDGLVGMVMRLYNDTLGQLERADHALCPAGTDVEGISEWCWGYVQGLELDDTDSGDESDEVLDSLEVIDVLAGQVPAKDAMPSGADETAWLAEQRSRLLDHAVLLYREWAEARAAAVPHPPTPKPRPAVGRNDPCATLTTPSTELPRRPAPEASTGAVSDAERRWRVVAEGQDSQARETRAT
jgi:yecA family protein